MSLKETVGEKTIRANITVLRRAYEFAADFYGFELGDPFVRLNEFIPEDPIEETDEGLDAPPAVWRFDEGMKILEGINKGQANVTRFMFLTGLGASEIAGIRKQDIHGDYLLIRNFVARRQGPKKKGKSKYRRRKLRITVAIRECLDEALRVADSRPYSNERDEYVFLSVTGLHFSCSIYYGYWGPALRRAGLYQDDYKSPYSTRHTFAAWALAVGKSPDDPAGAIFSGIRIYLKYIPFFFLPAVYKFSDRDIAKQFKFLLICSIIQLPVAVYQRFIESKGSFSGDAVRGTLNNSSTLSVFLICGIALLLAFLYKKRIKRSLFFIIFFLFFLPTTINETKGTVILLPLALIVTTFFMSGIKRKSKQILFVLAALFALASIFEPIYDHYQKPRYGFGIRDFFTSERGGMQKSIYKGLTGENSDLRPGRVDAVILPFEILGKEPHKLIFGLGIGNVSFSFFKGFSGEYTKYNFFIRASMSNLLWEIGILGVILFLAFFCLVFLDAYRLRRSDDLSGAIALGWTAVVVILVLSLFYINYIHRNVIVYLFWYISGYIAAKACRAGVSPRPSQA